VEKLLKTGKTVTLPKAAPFSASLGDAHLWSIMTVVKYIKECVDLEQSETDFKAAAINGVRFLGMDSDNLSSIKFSSKLHSIKVVSHAQKLREKVFEKAFLHMPEHFEDWHHIHVGSYLHFKSCPNGAKLALRWLRPDSKLGLDGSSVYDLESASLSKVFALLENDGSTEAEMCVKLLRDCADAQPKRRVSPEPIAEKIDETNTITHELSSEKQPGKAGKKNGSTAMKRRSDKKKRAEELAAGALQQHSDNDFDLPPEAPPPYPESVAMGGINGMNSVAPVPPLPTIVESNVEHDEVDNIVVDKAGAVIQPEKNKKKRLISMSLPRAGIFSTRNNKR
jgi:hypothetical protein